MIKAPATLDKASGYFATFDTTPSISIGATATRSWLIQHRQSRIRQDGTLKELELRIGTLTGYTSVAFAVRRWNGATYTLIGTTENVISKLTANSTVRFALDSQIVGCKEEDYIEPIVAGTPGSGSIFVGTAAGAGKANLWAAETTVNPMNWEAQANTADVFIKINAYMDTAEIAYGGDSHILGANEHRSFIENRDVSEDHTLTDVASTIQRHVYSMSGWRYQNMGIGGEQSSALAVRIAADIGNVPVVVIHSFWNDVRAAMPATPAEVAAVHASMTASLNAISAAVAHRHLIVLEPDPLTAEPEANHRAMDAWIPIAKQRLAQLETPTAARRMVMHRDITGVTRAGAPAGTRWDWLPGYGNADGLHPSPLVRRMFAGILYREIVETLAPFTPVVVAREVATPRIYARRNRG